MVTTTATGELQRYKEQVPLGAAIGRLCWYSISEMAVSHDAIKQGLTDNGLVSHIPPMPRDSDVFKRVSTAAQRRNVATSRAGVFRHYMIRPVSGVGEAVIVRSIVIEEKDTHGKRLGYKRVRDFEFDRATSRITTTDKFLRIDAVTEAITREVIDEYNATRGHLNSYAVRELIRNLLLKAGATMVREGVYFLPEANAGTVDALEAFANGLGNSVSFHSLPLVDDVKQRAMVKRAFEAESVDAVDKMMDEISTIRRAGTAITEDRYANMLTSYRELVKRTKEYEALLETGLTGTHSRLEIFQKQIVQLIEMVKH